MRWAGERRGSPFADYERAVALVGGRARGLLGGDLGVLRRARLEAVRARARLARDAGRELVRGRGAQLRREPARRARGRSATRVAVLHASELRELDTLTWGELRGAGGRRRRRAARARRGPRRPRGRLHAEHPRDADRVPRDGEHRGDLVERRARVRRAQRDRPLRADRAEGAARRRRLPPRRQGLRPHARCSRASSPSCRPSSTSSRCPTSRTRGSQLGGLARRAPASDLERSCSSAARAPRRASSRCRSTTRCGCSTPPAPPACRRRSCRATAGSCSSSSRSACTSTCAAGDRMFWFTTTGWMMWNFLVGCLHSEAAIVLYDGSPAHPDLGALWALAERAGMTCMGVSAGLLASAEKAGVEPAPRLRPPRAARDRLDGLAARAGELPLGLRARRRGRVAVLDQRRHRRVHRVRRRLPAAAGVRGRTAVPRARLRGGGLGRAGPQRRRRGGRARDHRADALDAAVPVGRRGRRAPARELLRDVPGHLAPRRLDPHHARAAERVIYGRSDSTINRQGVRMGTSEIYRAAAGVDEVLDALVVDVPAGDGAGAAELWMILFVVLRDGVTLDDELAARIKRRIREDCSPRHVPNEVRQIEEVPRTLSGKVLEVPVKRILMGAPPRARRRASTRSPTRARSTTSSSSPARWPSARQSPPDRRGATARASRAPLEPRAATARASARRSPS